MIRVMNFPKRKSIRLQGYDYSQSGFYFITICTQNHLCLFGEIDKNGSMKRNPAGDMIEKWWHELDHKYPPVFLHDHIVMPNHFHGIIQLNHSNELAEHDAYSTIKPTTSLEIPSISTMVGWFKTMTVNEYIRNVKSNNWRPFRNRLWQRNYYEHVIRDEDAWLEISEYIRTNPLRWVDDKYYRNAK